jgi:hypothetical protein
LSDEFENFKAGVRMRREEKMVRRAKSKMTKGEELVTQRKRSDEKELVEQEERC